MALVRATALKDFRTTALSTTDVSTGYQLGPLTSGQVLYGGLHLTQLVGASATARVMAMALQIATASGFGSPLTAIQFALSTVYGAEWGVPLPLGGAFTTNYSWVRASWPMTTTASTAGTWKGLVWTGIK